MPCGQTFGLFLTGQFMAGTLARDFLRHALSVFAAHIPETEGGTSAFSVPRRFTSPSVRV
jgi:hypothetical protein